MGPGFAEPCQRRFAAHFVSESAQMSRPVNMSMTYIGVVVVHIDHVLRAIELRQKTCIVDGLVNGQLIWIICVAQLPALHDQIPTPSWLCEVLFCSNVNILRNDLEVVGVIICQVGIPVDLVEQVDASVGHACRV